MPSNLQRPGYGGGDYRQNNPYAQQDNYNPHDNYGGGQGGYGAQGGQDYNQGSAATGNYEMTSMNNSGPGGADSQQEFFGEVNELREGIDQVKANITRIESLHQRSLTDIDESTSSQTQHQLDSLVAETSALNSALANRIRGLKGKAATDPSKAPQVNNLDRSFKDVLRKYQSVEATFQKRAREQMARQYRIVRPDATEQEVEEACSDGQGQQIFSQALLSGNRRGEARSALREVQARHNEIQRIEKTIIELADLFTQMEQLVIEQEAMVENIDQRGQEVSTNVAKAQEEIGMAVEKARSRRRKKWWCLLIVHYHCNRHYRISGHENQRHVVKAWASARRCRSAQKHWNEKYFFIYIV
ncbi:t-SNARE, partial [Tuber magnatum]